MAPVCRRLEAHPTVQLTVHVIVVPRCGHTHHALEHNYSLRRFRLQLQRAHYTGGTTLLQLIIFLSQSSVWYVHFEQIVDKPGMINWSRGSRSAVPSGVSPLVRHTQAESGALSRDSSRFPRRRPYIQSTAIGLSGDAVAYR